MMDDGAQLRNRINKQVYNAMHGRKRMKLNAKLLHCLAHKQTVHTSYNSFYKWTKISSLKITIFHLKIMVKSGLDFLF